VRRYVHVSPGFPEVPVFTPLGRTIDDLGVDPLRVGALLFGGADCLVPMPCCLDQANNRRSDGANRRDGGNYDQRDNNDLVRCHIRSLISRLLTGLERCADYSAVHRNLSRLKERQSLTGNSWPWKPLEPRRTQEPSPWQAGHLRQ
jgi:hypothetical protein